ncbi:hydroxyisourate hydrolase [Clostridium perfringens]|nr:hydroxyisourate hydrolase [Clostridium perfringens]
MGYADNCQYGEMDDLEELFMDVECNNNDNSCECCDDGRDDCWDDCRDNCWDDCRDDCCRRPRPKSIPKKGTIEVQSLLGCSDGEPISGMPVQLFKVDCNTGFELVACKETDRRGRCVFRCLEDGLYAVKQPVDRCFFEAPEYYPCYEVCISPRNKFARIVIINKLRDRDRDDCDRRPIRCRCNDKRCCR